MSAMRMLYEGPFTVYNTRRRDETSSQTSRRTGLGFWYKSGASTGNVGKALSGL